MTPVCGGEDESGVESSDTILRAGSVFHWHILTDSGGGRIMRLYRGRGHQDPARAADKARDAFNDWMSR